MVKYILASFIAVIFSLLAQAQVSWDTDEMPQSYSFASIKQVAVKTQRLSNEGEPERCANFSLKSKDVIDYFKSAKRIEWNLYNYLHTSGCYATGEIVFRNGDHGTWQIDKSRLGVLTLSNGKRACFYGLKARARVFEKANPHYADPDFSAPKKPNDKILQGNIASIVFRNDLVWETSEEQDAGQCRFELSESDVRDYFAHAKIIDLGVYNDHIFGKGKRPVFPAPKGCHVGGSIVFEDGRTGFWMIANNRTGILDLKDGDRVFLYAENAQAQGFSKP